MEYNVLTDGAGTAPEQNEVGVTETCARRFKENKNKTSGNKSDFVQSFCFTKGILSIDFFLKDSFFNCKKKKTLSNFCVIFFFGVNMYILKQNLKMTNLIF
ncbi:hypothetical protein AB9T88_05540 [Flavobacterium sp. LBUM151]